MNTVWRTIQVAKPNGDTFLLHAYIRPGTNGANVVVYQHEYKVGRKRAAGDEQRALCHIVADYLGLDFPHSASNVLDTLKSLALATGVTITYL